MGTGVQYFSLRKPLIHNIKEAHPRAGGAESVGVQE
jgi:hypothetical protein